MMKRYLILVFVLYLLVGCGSESKPGDTRVRDADGMVMVYVPAGEFLMGLPGGEGWADSSPQHAVYLDAYWID